MNDMESGNVFLFLEKDKAIKSIKIEKETVK